MALEKAHLVILGASGQTSAALVEQVVKLGDAGPRLTLYIRSSGRSKLPTGADGRRNIRIVQGALDNRASLLNALSADTKTGFPKATCVISLLGAYVSLWNFVTRRAPTPITNALSSTVMPAMREVGVKRILALSTLSGFQLPEEARKMDWLNWFKMLPPKIIVPQGYAEMRGIANVVVVAGASDPGLEWTVFRVPYLNDADASTPLSAGELFVDFSGGDWLSRGSIAKWLLDELVERRHVRKAPLLGNTA